MMTLTEPKTLTTSMTDTPKILFEYREQWLNAAMPFIRLHFQAAGYTVPPNIRIACGWPSKNATSSKKRRIGECWSSQCSEDEQFEIFISPCLANPCRVLDILIHEVVHAVVGIEAGHKSPFSRCAAAVGLVKPWTATTASPELNLKLADWADVLGQYPHGVLAGMDRKKEATRMLLMQCECGLKIRTTQKWIDEYGPEWPCPCSGTLVSK